MFVFCTHSLGACLEPKDRSSHENVSCDRVIAAEHIEEAACYTCEGMFTDMECCYIDCHMFTSGACISNLSVHKHVWYISIVTQYHICNQRSDFMSDPLFS